MKTPDKETFLGEMRTLDVTADDPYIRVYPAFLRFFNERKTITQDDFVIAANFTYGWMPRMLTLRGTDRNWNEAANLLQKARDVRLDSALDLDYLMEMVNNSLISVSKILHFVNPKRHAIWDSRVYKYLTNEEPHSYRLHNTDNYLRYLEICDEIASWTELSVEIDSLRKKIRQKCSVFRAIELTMFIEGAKR
jgi:hypothetical protein